jgi:MFS family permease
VIYNKYLSPELSNAVTSSCREIKMNNKAKMEPAYRWVIVIATAVILALAMGMMVNGVSVFVIPLSEEYGWQRGSVSFINVSGLIGLAAGGIVMGRIADRTTTRSVCLFGASVFGVCLLTAAYADTLWQFYLLFFLAGFFGGGSLFAPLIANVGNWFKTGAGLAIGITAAGQALGQGGVPYASSLLMSEFGWRGALTVWGAIALVTLIPLTLLISQPPDHVTSSSAGNANIHDDSPVPIPTNIVIIWLSAAVIFCCTCMAVPLMHLVPLIQDRGFSSEEASSVGLLMLIIAIFGRIAFGKLADMIGAIPAYMAASFWQTVLVFGFMQFQSLNAFYIYALIYGFGYAGVMTGVLVTVRALTPVSRRAGALGIIMVFAWLGHGIGGYQGGFFFDLTGDYTASYANAALAGIINLIIVGSLYFTIQRRNHSIAMAG